MAIGKQGHDETIIKKVSKRGEEGGHGGAWKVAFADFVLALMCLFMLLWVLAARDKEEIEKVLLSGGGSPVNEGSARAVGHDAYYPKGSLIPRDPVPGPRGSENTANSAVRDNSHPSVTPQQSGARVSYETPEQMKALAKKLSDMSVEAGLAGHLQTVVTPWGLRVMLHDTEREGMFELGSAKTTPRFKALLGEMGAMFARIDNQLMIVGHTDALQYRAREGATFSNWALSGNRALAARADLLAGGMPEQAVLQVVGMAERAPLDPARPTAPLNRRIELLVLTGKQAGAISAMFGPQSPTPAQDKSLVLPAAGEVEALRGDLR
ncbi:flagellar motor protein MotB [Crenobacter caeni]|uniref:OmpA family protein n=1 Tax=Crenobacter caeni TaxID=2705474 RepID=A0A6B2KS48_9NEIS|nr:OmpA family protein [Crenobacter caeni]